MKKIIPNQLVLSVDARRELEKELNGSGWKIYREKSRQINLFTELEWILEFTRQKLDSPTVHSTVHLERVVKNLQHVQKDLAKLPQWQRSKLDLGTRRAAERLGYARDGNAPHAHRSPRTLLGRVSGDGALLSDWFIDPFQKECELIVMAADELVAIDIGFARDRNHGNSLPHEIQEMVSLLGDAWWRAYGKRPSDKPNGAFASFVNSLLSSLRIKQVGGSQLRRILQAQKVSD